MKTYPILVLISLSCLLAIGCNHTKPCVAGPDEACGSDAWRAEATEYKALLSKYSAPAISRDDQIKLKGLYKDMQEKVTAEKLSPGMQWDFDKMKFVKIPPPVAVVPPSPPVTPAAPAKK